MSGSKLNIHPIRMFINVFDKIKTTMKNKRCIPLSTHLFIDI